MNKSVKTIFSLAMIGLLTGCNGNKVSQEKFEAACKNLENHQYYQLTIKYEVSIKTTDNGSEDITSEARTLTYAYRYVYVEETDEWLWAWCRTFEWENEDEEIPFESECLHLIHTVKDGLPAVATTASYSGIKVSTTFYTSPLKITTKVKGKTTGTNYTRTSNNSYLFEYKDEYGYTTKYTETIDETYNGKTIVGGTNIYRDQVRKGTKKVTITYSDEKVEE